MNWLLNSSFAQHIGMTLVHSLWQILFVAAAFAVVNRLLARRTANLRYVLAYAALLLMLVLPLVTLSWLVLSADSTREEERIAGIAPPMEDTSLVNMGMETDVAFPVMDVAMAPIAIELEPTESTRVLLEATGDPAAVESRSETTWSSLLPWLSVAWSLGVIAFAIRPFLALQRCHQIRKQAVALDERWITDIVEKLCSRIGLTRTVEIANSALVHVPTVIGFVRPIILLPLSVASGQTPDELSAIIAHELAHIRRHDFLFNLFQTAIETLLFYHPAVWWVSSVVRQERENCCDDIAMAVCGRKTYATALANLEFARTKNSSLAVAADGGSLYRRIRRIVRPHENPNPLGRWLAAIVAMSALLLGIVAVLPDSAAATDDQSEQIEENLDDDLVTVRGVVFDPDGNPAADATVAFANWLIAKNNKVVPLSETKTGSDGRFELSFRKSQLNRNIGQFEQWKNTELNVRKEGFGPVSSSYRDLAGKDEVTFQLAKDGVPIEGEILDLEGQSVPNASITVASIAIAKDNDLTDWIAAIKNGEETYRASRYIEDSVLDLGRPVIKADEQGQFRVRNIGNERYARLVVEGPTIARTTVMAMTRPHEPISRSVGEVIARKQTIYGAKFRIAIPPTQVIRGVVRDAESEEPIAGVSVESWKFAGTRTISTRMIKTVTDENGKFELVGMPSARGNEIIAIPQDGQPYFMQQVEVPHEEPLNAASVDIKLHRGVVIRGRLTDKRTGEPIVARLHYFPFLDNEFAEGLPEFGDYMHGHQDRYESKPDGTFEVIGLPGRAIVGAECVGRPYRHGVGADEIAGMNEHGHFPTFRNPLPANKKWLNTLVEIDVDPDTRTHEVDMQLDPGGSISVRMVDDRGKPVRGVNAYGRVPSGYSGDVETAAFDVIALAPDEERTVVLHHRKRNIGQVIRVKPTDDARDVKLEACSSVKGQLLDEDGDPLPGVTIRVDVLPSGDFGKELPAMTTDSEGRFEHQSIIPGTKYGLYTTTANVGFKRVVTDLELRPGEARDLGVLRLKEDGFEPDKTDPPKVATKAPAAKPMGEKRPDNGIRTFSGKVIDAEGKPVAGVKVYAENILRRVDQPVVTKELKSTYSAADGSYSLTFRPEDGSNPLIATKEGYGSVFVSYTQLHRLWKQDKTKLDLRLANEKAITGRVVDTEGKPLSGITIQVEEIAFPKSEAAVEKWIKNEKPELFARPVRRMMIIYRDTRVASTAFPVAGVAGFGSVLPAKVKSDEDGRFRLAGVGENYRVRITLSGPNIARRDAMVVARDMKSVVAFAERIRGEDYTHHGALPTLVASPTQPIVGRVVDAKTKQPLSNMSVLLVRAGKGTSVRGAERITDVTDSDGRFRLEGAPLGGQHVVEVRPSLDEPYFDTERELPLASGSAPLVCDFELPKATWIRGKVTDQAGNPMAAKLVFYPYLDNPHAKAFSNFEPGVRGVPDERFQTEQDGSFRIRAIPGRALLAGVVSDRNERVKYLPNREKDLLERIGGQSMDKVFHGWSADYFDALVEVNVPNDGSELTQNVFFKLGGTRTVDIKNEGEPLTEILAIGRTFPPNSHRSEPLEDSKLEVVGLQPNESRMLVLFHEQRKLGKVLNVTADDSTPLSVSLLPCAAVTGRVVDLDGEGVKNYSVRISPIQEPKTDTWSRELKRVQTDSEGRFRLLLPPGGAYRVFTYTEIGPNFEATIRPKPGATYDLGDVKDDDELEESQTSKLAHVATATARVTSAPSNILANRKHDVASLLTYSGRVLDEDGSPAKDAHVAVIATEKDGQVWYPRTAVETTTDADGAFQLRLVGISDRTHTNARLVTRTEQSGIAWRKLGLRQTEQKELGDIKLLESTPLQCRLISLEGRPAANVEVEVNSMAITVRGNERLKWLPFFGLKQPPKAWIQRMRTDENGVLTIPNVARGHGVNLNVLPSDQFAPQQIALNTGTAETRGDRDGTYRDTVKNLRPGEVPSIPLSPAKIFEGVVRLADTGQPAANCKIEIWASQQEFGSMMSIFDKTDDQGRFRLNPYPGIRFGIKAYPPDGTAYQIKRYGDLDTALRWTSGEESKNIEIELSKGVIAAGQIVDGMTGEPIVNASVEYRPMGTNPNNSDDIVTGWQGIKKTNEEGEFQISALPGEGWLLVHTNSRDHVLQEKTGRRLSYDKPGGMRIYAHAFVKINPDGDVNVGKVKLTPSRTVTLEVVDPEGKPIDEGLAISRLHVGVHAGWWRGQNPDKITDGRVEIGGVGDGVDYPIYLLDPKRMLGAIARINAEQTTQKVTLQPCGSAVRRYVDGKGDPLAGKSLALYMVVTPGVSRFDYDAMRNEGAVGADQDFVANIDRLNHWKNRSGDDGQLVLSALIPGATYLYPSGPARKLKEFVAKSGEVFDLGKIVIDEES